jgi:hypothetical protein
MQIVNGQIVWQFTADVFMGGSPPPPPTIVSPPPPAPTPVAPVVDQTALNAANKKAVMAAAQNSGRMSTILTSGQNNVDKLG